MGCARRDSSSDGRELLEKREWIAGERLVRGGQKCLSLATLKVTRIRPSPWSFEGRHPTTVSPGMHSSLWGAECWFGEGGRELGQDRGKGGIQMESSSSMFVSWRGWSLGDRVDVREGASQSSKEVMGPPCHVSLVMPLPPQDPRAQQLGPLHVYALPNESHLTLQEKNGLNRSVYYVYLLTFVL